MASTLELALLAVALILNGLLAGASLDKAITQLPARRKIGLRAMAEYHRATDLGPGLFWYPILGLGAPLLTLAAAVALLQGGDVSSGAILWIAVGAVLLICNIAWISVRQNSSLKRGSVISAFNAPISLVVRASVGSS